ncbi:MAG: hypothetical protein JW846_11590, partial [Dehalococcoidia bacterium]|nr:hypothetical protein [Dehalococcoidia bacterium]
AIAKVKLAEILNDADTADLYAYSAALVGDPSMPPTLDAALANVQAQTGVDPKHLDEVTLFADLSTLGDEFLWYGAIVRLDIPAKYLFEAARVFGKLDFPTQEHNGYRTYLIDADVSLAFLGRNLIVVGPLDVVEAVIDTGLGYSEPVSGEVRDLYEGLVDSPVRLAFQLPATVKAEIATISEGGFFVDLSPLTDISVVTCVLEKYGQTITGEAQMHFTDVLSAQTTAGLVQDAITFSEYVVPQPELTATLKKIQVAEYSSLVSASLQMSVTEVKDLMWALA